MRAASDGASARARRDAGKSLAGRARLRPSIGLVAARNLPVGNPEIPEALAAFPVSAFYGETHRKVPGWLAKKIAVVARYSELRVLTGRFGNVSRGPTAVVESLTSR
jgi:hypothetical protein